MTLQNDRVVALTALQFYDALLVNPIIDGMNLVAKEGPAVNKNNGVLVLSRSSGAFQQLALACIPAPHLKLWCERILADIQANRSGFPDLIQFWPDERRYHMIEVKGPGDRPFPRFSARGARPHLSS